MAKKNVDIGSHKTAQNMYIHSCMSGEVCIWLNKKRKKNTTKQMNKPICIPSAFV